MVSSDARIVNVGVDTLVLNAFYTQDGRPVKKELDASLYMQLEAWKKSAQSVGDAYPTSWLFQEKCLLMQPNGAGGGQWQWMLKTRDITLYISSGNWNSIASVRLNADYLWSSPDLMTAIMRVNALLYDIFHDMMYLQVSSVDLCVDVAGWQDITHLDRCHNFVSHARKRAEHYTGEDISLVDNSSGLKQTGFDFSKRGVMSCTIYDKTRELKKSGKSYFLDLWRARGWSEDDGPVWRVEMKFKRQALHELKTDSFHGIDDAYELVERLPILWAYATGHPTGGTNGLPDGWLRCVLPNEDTNRARWPTHPVWRLLQTAYMTVPEMPEHFGRIVRKRREEQNIDKGIVALLGYATSVAAWASKELGDDYIDLSMFLHWFMERGEKMLKKQKRDFAEEVERKRVMLGA